MALPILEQNATKEQLIVALNEADKLLLDNIFFKKLAKRLGKTDAKRKEQDDNVEYVLSLFDSVPEKVILHYNLRAAVRTGLQGIGQKLLNIGLEYGISRINELMAHGMSYEHASEVAYLEVNDLDNDDEDIT